MLTTAAAADAQEDYTVLYAFPGGSNDDPQPTTPLLHAADGKVYVGTTLGLARLDSSGMPVLINDDPVPHNTMLASDGYLYMVTPSQISRIPLDGGAPIVLQQLTHASEGDFAGPLVEGDDGNLYGFRRSLGDIFGWAPPVIYRITPAGELSTFLQLGPPADIFPYAPLAKGIDGNFYLIWHGILFRVTPDGGAATPLHAFNPQYEAPGIPLQTSDGTIYGTVNGAVDPAWCGSIYKVDPAGTFATVHRFSVTAHDGCGVNPVLVQASDGTVYGTSWTTIFRVTTTTGDFRLLHRSEYPGGSIRYGWNYLALLEGAGGDFYGVAGSGGPAGSWGVIFRLNRLRLPCVNDIDLTWGAFGEPLEGGYLRLFGAVKSETPALWITLFLSRAGIVPLWKTTIPTIDPTYAYIIGADFSGGIGTIGVFTLLMTSSGNICADWSTADTGGTGATAEELRQMLPQAAPLLSP
jgi:outer membrane protein assembly factor BamB